MTSLGIIGAGNVGSNVARRAVLGGYDVIVSNSRGPETLADLVSELGPQATAGTPTDAAGADIVLVAIPTRAIDSLPIAALTGKTVIDADNYYTDRDGVIAELDSDQTTSSERLAKLLPDSHVVKTFNHIYGGEISSTALAPGSTNRRAIAVFGDSTDAKAATAALVNAVGFDVVDAGSLAEGWRLQPGTPGYCVPLNSTDLKKIIADTTRG